ncbi:hypothetical protein AMK59_1391, partial [Oryctes borbonicus]
HLSVFQVTSNFNGCFRFVVINMIKLLPLIFAVITGINAQQNYNAAVLEYSPQIRNPTHTDAEYVATNVRRYIEFIGQAVSRQANIVVFPEYGLTTTNLPENLFNVSTTVPDPVALVSPCVNRTEFVSFFLDLSCAANEHNIFVVVNLIERANNIQNETIYYNTNVVFSSNGTVIARYRKINLFNEPQLTAGNEVVTFVGFNNITFGLFTCFDILFRTPAQDVLALGATDIIYLTAWTSETPFHHSFSIQDGYAKANGVNLLVSGYSNVTNGMAGAAIFSADGAIISSSVTPAAAQNIFSATLNVIMRRTPEAVCNNSTIGAPRIGVLPEITAVLLVMHENMDLYTFEDLPLNVNTTSGQICSEGTDFCCDYHIEFQTSLTTNSTIYKMAAFFGRRGFQGAITSINTIGVRTCALLHCSSTDNLSCGLFNATTNVNFRSIRITARLPSTNSSYQPATLDTNHTPLTSFNFCTTPDEASEEVQLDLHVNNPQNVFSFGIFGRVHTLDGLPEGRGAASTVHVALFAIITCICLVLLY